MAYRLKTIRMKDQMPCDLSKFPCFHKSGSISGMKKKFYGKNALLVKHGHWIYNVDRETYDSID